jgi:hypothetical protein
MRKLILVLLFITFSMSSFAQRRGGGGGGVRGGFAGTGSRVVVSTGNGGAFIGGNLFRGNYGYRGRYGYGYSGLGLGYGAWPGYYGYGYGYDFYSDPFYLTPGSPYRSYPPSYYYKPSNRYSGPYGDANSGNTPNVSSNADPAPSEQNTGSVAHSGAVVITVGPDGYTKDGVFHSFR